VAAARSRLTLWAVIFPRCSSDQGSICLSLPVRHERGESRPVLRSSSATEGGREGLLIINTTSPRPSPPAALGGEGANTHLTNLRSLPADRFQELSNCASPPAEPEDYQLDSSRTTPLADAPTLLNQTHPAGWRDARRYVSVAVSNCAPETEYPTCLSPYMTTYLTFCSLFAIYDAL
jgi:hypothetical protein